MAGKVVPIFDLSPKKSSRTKKPIFPFLAILALLVWYFYCYDTSEGGVRSTIRVNTKAIIKQVTNHQQPQGIDSFTGLQTLDLSHLKYYVKTPSFSYAHRTIKTKKVYGERPELTRIKDSLYSNPIILEKSEIIDDNITIDAATPLTLQVPISPPIDTSIMSFGIATKITRLEISLPNLQHWLPDTGAQLHVHLEKSEKEAEVQTAFEDAGINLTLHPTTLPFAHSYFSLIKTLYENRSPHTKWLVLIDDDTFFPSLPYLVKHLAQNYDASTETMVAAMSDKMDQIATFGLLPFGGGGIFISIPLAKILTGQHIWQDCMQSDLDQGDQIVNECLNAHTSVRPVFDRGLNQMDIEGDASGYYESGRRMLSLHHWRSWYMVDVPAAGKVADACGFEGVFMRWLFDDNTVLSNGYSISEYPNGMSGKGGETKVDLNGVEKTWMFEAWRFEHFIGPLREPLEREEKRQFRLVEATALEGLGVRQTYVDARVDEEEFDDRVVELLWLF